MRSGTFALSAKHCRLQRLPNFFNAYKKSSAYQEDSKSYWKLLWDLNSPKKDIQVYQTPFNVWPVQDQDWWNCKSPLQRTALTQPTVPTPLAQSHLFLETHAMEFLPQVTTLIQLHRKLRPHHSGLYLKGLEIYKAAFDHLRKALTGTLPENASPLAIVQ